MNEDHVALSNFTGTAKLFPLPGLVFFPHAIQPLHIFEPRYRRLVSDALAGDQLIALVLLKNGWEEDYDHKPRIHPVGCLGRVIADQLLPDGRYNLVLRGMHRIRIGEEIETGNLYRTARVSLIKEVVSDDIDHLMSLRTTLSTLLRDRFTDGAIRKQLETLFTGELPLGTLCDLLIFALPLPPETKQQLLETDSVDQRAHRLIYAFQKLVTEPTLPETPRPNRKFPPDFSQN